MPASREIVAPAFAFLGDFMLRIALFLTVLPACRAACPVQIAAPEGELCKAELRRCGESRTLRIVRLRKISEPKLVVVRGEMTIGVALAAAKNDLRRFPEDGPTQRVLSLMAAATGDLRIDDPQLAGDVLDRIDLSVSTAYETGEMSLAIGGVESRSVIFVVETHAVYSDTCVLIERGRGGDF